MLGASLLRPTGVLIATVLACGFVFCQAKAQVAGQPRSTDGAQQRLLLVQAIQRAGLPDGEASGDWDCDIGDGVVSLLNKARDELGLRRFFGRGVRNRISNADLLEIAVFYQASLDVDEFKSDLCSRRSVRESVRFTAVEMPSTDLATDIPRRPETQTIEEISEPETPDTVTEVSGAVAENADPNEDKPPAGTPEVVEPALKEVVTTDPASVVDDESGTLEAAVLARKVTVPGYTDLEYSNIGIAIKVNVDCVAKEERDPLSAIRAFLKIVDFDRVTPSEDLFLVSSIDGKLDLVQATSGRRHTASDAASGGHPDFSAFLEYLESDDGRAFRSTLGRSNYTLVLSRSQFDDRQIMSALPDQAAFSKACIDFASQLFRASDKYGIYYLVFSRIIDARYADDLAESNISTVFTTQGIYSVALEGTSLLGKVDKIAGQADQLLMLDPISDPFEILEQLSETKSFSSLSLIRL